MKTSGRVPGARLAIGAFVLTVLLGLGGASASALWQQSATATMTVTADVVWPGPAIKSLACTNKSNDKEPVLTVTLPQAATLSLNWVRPNGSQTAAITFAPASATHRIALNDTGESDIAGTWTVRVTAAYSDGTTAAGESKLTFTTPNDKRKCA